MNKRKNLLRHLNTLLIIAIVFGAVLACADICIFLIDTNAGFIILGILVIYFAIFIYSYITEKKKVLQQFVDFATEYYQIQKRLIKEHVIPYAMLDESGKVIWMNDAFKECMNVDDGFNKPISAVIPTVTRETLDKLDDSYDAVTEVDERIFRVQIKRFDFGEFAEEIMTGEDIIFNGYLYGIYLMDETKLHGYIKALDDLHR